MGNLSSAQREHLWHQLANHWGIDFHSQPWRRTSNLSPQNGTLLIYVYPNVHRFYFHQEQGSGRLRILESPLRELRIDLSRLDTPEADPAAERLNCFGIRVNTATKRIFGLSIVYCTNWSPIEKAFSWNFAIYEHAFSPTTLVVEGDAKSKLLIVFQIERLLTVDPIQQPFAARFKGWNKHTRFVLTSNLSCLSREASLEAAAH